MQKNSSPPRPVRQRYESTLASAQCARVHRHGYLRCPPRIMSSPSLMPSLLSARQYHYLKYTNFVWCRCCHLIISEEALPCPFSEENGRGEVSQSRPVVKTTACPPDRPDLTEPHRFGLGAVNVHNAVISERLWLRKTQRVEVLSA